MSYHVWTFYFDTGSVSTSTQKEEEHQRLDQVIKDITQPFFSFVTEKETIYVNKDMVKCAVAQLLDHDPLTKKEEEAKVVAIAQKEAESASLSAQEGIPPV